MFILKCKYILFCHNTCNHLIFDRFGDFVKIRNGDSYLALSQHYGISPGLTIKPLTTGKVSLRLRPLNKNLQRLKVVIKHKL